MSVKQENRVRIPQVKDIETAIRLYYERIELSNSDIRKLFGDLAAATVVKLKKKARQVITEENIMEWNNRNVNTEAAFKAWGLDIADLERRYKKIAALDKKEKNKSPTITEEKINPNQRMC